MSRFTWSVGLHVSHGDGWWSYRETAVRADGVKQALERAVELQERAAAAEREKTFEIVGVWQSDALELVSAGSP